MRHEYVSSMEPFPVKIIHERQFSSSKWKPRLALDLPTITSGSVFQPVRPRYIQDGPHAEAYPVARSRNKQRILSVKVTPSVNVVLIWSSEKIIFGAKQSCRNLHCISQFISSSIGIHYQEICSYSRQTFSRSYQLVNLKLVYESCNCGPGKKMPIDNLI